MTGIVNKQWDEYQLPKSRGGTKGRNLFLRPENIYYPKIGLGEDKYS